MPRVSLVRGYQISIPKLDDFLESYGFPGTEGSRIWPHEMKQVSEIFRSNGVDCDTWIFRPTRMGCQNPRHMYVCYDWVDVFGVKQVDGCLTKPVPRGFDEIRQALCPEAEIGTFLVFDEELDWIPEPLAISDEVKPNRLLPDNKRKVKADVKQTERPPCEICAEPTDSWDDWEKHRIEKHGASKEQRPLPHY